MSYNETISDKSELAFKTVSVDLMNEIVQIMGEWNGDESGVLEDRSDAARELGEHIQASVELIDELQS